MTTPTTPKRSPEEIAKLGQEIFERVVRPTLKPEEGKYVAIDIATEEYEVDDSDYAAVMKIHGRNPGAEVWLMRVGYPAAYKLGLR
ncbi:MAG: hypothetical protein L0241_05025 [Planctomycetia bacterium]|nr:hypothetical protein [Planctomycetia bacterium]